MICGFWTFLFLACVLVNGIVTVDSSDTGNSLLDKALSNYNDKEKQNIIQNFESKLLQIFGLKSRPKPSSDIIIPQYMIDLYNQQISASNNLQFANSKAASANTIRSFVHTGMYSNTLEHVRLDGGKYSENGKQLCLKFFSVNGYISLFFLYLQ